MQRHGNPHVGFNQPSNQGLTQVGPNLFQAPNGALFLATPNGLVPYNPNQPQYFNQGMQPQYNPGNMMPQNQFNPGMGNQMFPMGQQPNQPGIMMNPGFNPNMGMQPNPPQAITQGRFGAMEQPGIVQNDPNMQRFGNIPNQPEYAKEVKMDIKPKSFSIKLERHIAFENNDKVILNTYMDPVKKSYVFFHDAMGVYDCIEDSGEGVANIFSMQSNLVTVEECLIVDEYVSVSNDFRQIFKELIKLDIKNLYKSLKKLYSELKTKYDLNAGNSFDTYLTTKINDFLLANVDLDVSIDSFMSDFNDLLKALRNNTETVEDDLCNYMDAVLSNLNENYDYISQLKEKDVNSEFYLIDKVAMVHIDKLSYELGIFNAPEDLTLIEPVSINAFLTSLPEAVFSYGDLEKCDLDVLYFVTIDKLMYKLVNGRKGVFIQMLG